jgi:predicted GH43/DUF377 family glycosyl hydrolase/tetratricopeptide (TPR) repeat protein
MRLFSSHASNLVDRDHPLSEWKRRLEWQSDQRSEVLIFSGVGGVGKTALCEMAIDQYLKPYEVPYAVVNFDSLIGPPASPEKTFISIRMQLRKYGIKFPTFDVVWARHWEQVTGQKLSKSVFPPELEDVADIAAFITRIPNPKSVTNLLKRLSSLLPKEHELALRLRDMNTDQLRRFMPEALAQDIERAMEKSKHRGWNKECRLTIIFDGFERLLETCKEEYRRDECDWWVQEFCTKCSSALKVICGREGVRWADQNPDRHQWLYHFTPLNNLPPSYADKYLLKRGVKNGELRNYLIDLTNGFPYHLKLAADLCNKIEKGGCKPTDKDFAGAESANDLGKDLLSRLLRQLQPDERDAAPLVAIPRWFTRDFLAALLPNPSLLDRLLNQLTSLAFCESVPNIPAYTLRKEVRRFLLEKPNPLMEYGDWKHKLFNAYLYAADKLSMGFTREGVLYYEREALTLAEELNDALLQAQSYLRLASSYNRLQRFHEAVEMVGKAYLAAERSGDQRVLAESLMLRAGIETSQNSDYGDFSLIDRALRTFREIGDKRCELNALHTKIGIALHKRQYQFVEKPLEVAEQICQQLKDQHLSAITLQLRGEYHSHIGQWAVAAEHLQRARQAFKRVVAELPRTVGVCAATGWLGLAKCRLGDVDNGLTLIHEALGTERDVLVSREGVAKWLHCLGELFWEQNSYADALTTLWLCQILRKELDHAELATTEKKIQEVRQKVGSKGYARMKKNFRPQDSDFYEYTYLRGIGPFRKYENNPILVPQGDSWESRTVYNPAAWTDGNKVYMLYRAEGPCDFPDREFCSRIGLATSTDGIHFTREAQPVLEPSEPYEKPGGCEDPRITQIDDKFYMTYTAYDGKVARLAMATSYDLRSWSKKGLLFDDAQWDAYFPRAEYPDNPRGWSKSGVILPRKVKNRYWMYFGDTCIWAASTTDSDLKRWEIIPEPVLRPRPRHFDSKLVEPGPPLLILPEGIWLGYNGADYNLRYAFGQALFALDDPTRLIHRCTYPLMEPATEDELEGQVRQVVFAEGLVSFKEQRLLYYGMADSRIGLAIAKATPLECVEQDEQS